MFGKVESLRELFQIELRYAYDCERKLVEKGLPTMIENAQSTQLQSAFQQHLEETRNHILAIGKCLRGSRSGTRYEGQRYFG